MKDQIDVKGASGVVYRFMLFKEGRPLSPMGGNYLYARETGGRIEVVYASEVQNLLQDARARWSEAAEQFGVAGLYTRLNISEGRRRHEHADVLAALGPPMNTEPQKKAS